MVSQAKCDYMKDLNIKQREVVISDEYPMMVIAGAGSGKTKTLVSKITYLIDKEDVDPHNIMALTFTNKAANELKGRVEKICSSAQYLMVGTFHSCFMRILQREHSRLGFGSNFSIYDTADSKALLKHIVNDLNFDSKIYEPKLVLSRISFLKSRLITPDNYYSSEYYSQDKIRLPAFDKIYFEYVKRCHQNNVMDFDDILLNIYILLRDNEDILKKYQDRFKYVFVDEFQDTNALQNEIIKMLIRRGGKLCVVGDDAQSIYAFRGAVIANILNFQRNFDGAKIFRLEQNYRSTKNIVNAANSIIEKNKLQIKKKVWTENKYGDKCFIIKSASDLEEAKTIKDIIKNEIKENDAQYSDFAVLYRMNFQSTVLETEFGFANIPCKVIGNISFFQRKEVKDFLAYLRVCVNQDDNESIFRTINLPKRGIGEASVKKLFNIAKENNVRVWDVLCQVTNFVEKRYSNLIEDYLELIKTGIVFAKTKNAHEVACFMYSAIGEKLCKEDQDKVHLKNLLESIDEFVKSNPDDPSLLNYINKTPLIAGENLDEYNDYVSLMTVHSAKGLEFKYVFIVGMEEKIFPSESALLAGELEDERRLFYVAMTRAKEKLFISYVTNRVLFGSAIISTKSRFLDEINPEFVEVSLPKKKSTGISIGRLYKTSFQDVKKCNGLHLESKVYHPMYNKYGKIKNFREVEGRIMVDIEFEDEQTVSIAENVLTLFNS